MACHEQAQRVEWRRGRDWLAVRGPSDSRLRRAPSPVTRCAGSFRQTLSSGSNRSRSLSPLRGATFLAVRRKPFGRLRAFDALQFNLHRDHQRHSSKTEWPAMSKRSASNGGEGGIRTLGGVSPTHPFQGCTIGHSVTSPGYFSQLRKSRRKRVSSCCAMEK